MISKVWFFMLDDKIQTIQFAEYPDDTDMQKAQYAALKESRKLYGRTAEVHDPGEVPPDIQAKLKKLFQRRE